jgi:hypothetical protein
MQKFPFRFSCTPNSNRVRIILCCISIGYFFICQVLVYYLKPLFSKNFYQLFLVTAVTGLAVLTFRIGNINGGFEIYVLIWLLLFLIASILCKYGPFCLFSNGFFGGCYLFRNWPFGLGEIGKKALIL